MVSRASQTQKQALIQVCRLLYFPPVSVSWLNLQTLKREALFQNIGLFPSYAALHPRRSLFTVTVCDPQVQHTYVSVTSR
jgi:hypothetical protein